MLIAKRVVDAIVRVHSQLTLKEVNMIPEKERDAVRRRGRAGHDDSDTRPDDVAGRELLVFDRDESHRSGGARRA